MLVDKTTNLDMVNAKKIISKLAKELTVKQEDIGICSSPLCMNGELACLTSLKARELAAIYSSNTEVALPSANHQCMNCCGCMRFFDINSDTVAPEDKVVKKAKSVSSNSKETTKKSTTKQNNASKFNYKSFI